MEEVIRIIPTPSEGGLRVVDVLSSGRVEGEGEVWGEMVLISEGSFGAGWRTEVGGRGLGRGG